MAEMHGWHRVAPDLTATAIPAGFVAHERLQKPVIICVSCNQWAVVMVGRQVKMSFKHTGARHPRRQRLPAAQKGRRQA